MSNLSIVTLPRITNKQLRTLILNPETASSLAIIDVRDDDYIGGHIANSQNHPSSTHGVIMPDLARRLAEKKTVVFHCMLSQQRGPSAALKYARERERLLKHTKGGGKVAVHGEDGGDAKQEPEDGVQRVLVLQGGFQDWVRAGFGEDERLTEGFVKEIWDDWDD